MGMNQQAKDKLKSQYGLEDSDFDQGDDENTLVTTITTKTGQPEAQVRQQVQQAQRNQ
jgi:hypothetical protein